MTTEAVQHVTPDASSLSSIIVNIRCPQGCSRTFANSSALRLHLSQVHHQETGYTAAANSDVWYHCPETSCIYHISFGINGKHFSKLKYLKQHYLKVHAIRDHVCECGRAFSTAAHLTQHRRACGLDLMCTCGRSFQAMETLQTHVRRFGHAIMHSTLQALRARKNFLAESVRASEALAEPTTQAVIAHHIPIKYQRINDTEEETIQPASSFPPSIAPTPAAICSATATLNHVTPIHFQQPTHLLAAIALSELAATSIKRLPCVDVGIQTEAEHGKRSRRKSSSPAKGSEYLGGGLNSRSFGKRKRTAETQTRLTHRDSKQLRGGSNCAPSPLSTPINSNESIAGSSYVEVCSNENGGLSGLSLEVDLPQFITTHQSTSGTQTSPRGARITTQSSLRDFTISFFDRACGEDEPGISPSLTTITSTQTSDLDSFESSQLLIEEDEELLGVVGDSAVVARQRPPSLGHMRSSSIETQTDHDVLLSKNADTPDDVDGIILTNTETQTDPSNLLIPNINDPYQNSGASRGCHIHEGDSVWCTSETQTYEDFSDIEQFMRSTIHTQTPDNSHSELFPELSFTHTQTQTSLDDPPSLVTTHTQTALNEL